MTAAKKLKYNIIDEVVHSHFRLYLRDDNIVQMDTSDHVYFTIKEAKEYLEALEKITKGIPRPVLKVPGKHATVDSETRSFMATHDALRFSIAEAVIIRNLAQRIIGNFYIKFDKPKKPVKLFDKIEDAEKWLLRYIK